MIYATLPEIEVFIAKELGTTKWDALTIKEKEAYVAIASDYMDMLGLTFPTVMPECVKKSIALMALVDLNAGLSLAAQQATAGAIESAKIGPVEVKYKSDAKVTVKLPSRYPARVRQCLSLYGAIFSCGIRQEKIGRC